MITLVIEAGLLPEDIIVRKVTGMKQYQLKRSIKIHADAPENRKEFWCDKGVVFLFAENGINCIPSTAKVAIDFETPNKAIDFLETLPSDDDD